MDNIFQFTMSGLTAGLRVVHIAALQLVTCEINQGIKEVLDDPKLIGFDYIPVLSRKRIFGIVERKRAGNEGAVKENMRALDDSLLVSADEPLTSFVSCLRTDPFRLVVKGTEIKGIVTRSDLIKLPVRLVAFTQICHLEMEMTIFIEARCKDDNFWVNQLKKKRRERLRERLEAHKKRNLELRLVELADFGDKGVAVVKLLGLDGKSERQLDEIQHLRNDIAHSEDYGKTEADIDRFLERLALTSEWIRRLSRVPKSAC
jgi:hypothetical protein